MKGVNMTNEKSAQPTLHIVYISIEGNTRAFVQKMQKYAQEMHAQNARNRLVTLDEVSEASAPLEIQGPFAVFVPTYLGGGNGINNGNNEILTTELYDTLTDFDNYKNCYGVVGSGNRNFNAQFGLTAKQYAAHFGFPLLDLFELRGTPKDVQKVYAHLNTRQTEFEQALKTD
ncbi:class Ib ribonucleoside-diphosphate reductase assembly flavoprotein NrdI [Liquorilactobacillus satsumensis]|uniref:Flavoprotein NrdI n=2 Tax=Liquorilactobacillus satsumensis TaxID=259059 RepID=A0A0R1V2V6_9LACO|nr:flavoprotein NrdI [Liquorilactobacillus satsumensis DSM 16230 = JCM 12392]